MVLISTLSILIRISGKRTQRWSLPCRKAMTLYRCLVWLGLLGFAATDVITLLFLFPIILSSYLSSPQFPQPKILFFHYSTSFQLTHFFIFHIFIYCTLVLFNKVARLNTFLHSINPYFYPWSYPNLRFLSFASWYTYHSLARFVLKII